MAVIKCKMCGAPLQVKENEPLCRCSYCGTNQTISTSKDENVLNNISRGVALRNSFEFDKAFNLYNQLIINGYSDAEIYWNLVLCKYGITYVDDYDGSKKPVMNRFMNKSILDDEDYKHAIEEADAVAVDVYKQEANKIADIQDNILKIINQESPYDIFICYKETDEIGERSEDSVIAQEIYDELVKDNYKVFLARVTLSEVAGDNYEAHIYSALLTSKIMIAVTTNDEYINSPWVKNEWSRFLAMMEEDKKKKLIPCYKRIDAYDLPKELRKFQAIDLDKLGAMQDLKIGIEKILNPHKSSNISNDGFNEISGKIRRSYILLDEKEFDKVLKLADDILNIDPENGEAYALYMLAELKTNYNQINENPIKLDDNAKYKLLMKFGTEEVKSKYSSINNAFYNNIYNNAIALMESNTVDNLKKANEMLTEIKGYKDSDALIKKNNDAVLNISFNDANKRYSLYKSGENFNFQELEDLCNQFEEIGNYKSCDIISKNLRKELKSKRISRLDLFSNSTTTYSYANWKYITSISGNVLHHKCSDTNHCYHPSDYYINIDEIVSIEVKYKWENGTYNIFVTGENSDVSYSIGDAPHAKKICKELYDRLKIIKPSNVEYNEEFFKLMNQSDEETKGLSLNKQGCYIATCVYGSYNCPEVWRLRRYRDFYLCNHWWGRAFIKLYYAISPTLVKWFGNKEWFRKPMKNIVDKKIEKAKKMGFEDSQYKDRDF